MWVGTYPLPPLLPIGVEALFFRSTSRKPPRTSPPTSSWTVSHQDTGSGNPGRPVQLCPVSGPWLRHSSPRQPTARLSDVSDRAHPGRRLPRFLSPRAAVRRSPCVHGRDGQATRTEGACCRVATALDRRSGRCIVCSEWYARVEHLSYLKYTSVVCRRFKSWSLFSEVLHCSAR